MNRHLALTTLALAIGALVAVGAVDSFGAPAARAADAAGSTYYPLTAVRLLDTRTDTTTLGAGSVRTIAVTGIPADATAVILNVTAVDGTAGSYLTVYPDGAGRPATSNLNWIAGQAATPNQVTVQVGGDGKVDFYNAHGSVDIITDLEGYFAGGTVTGPTQTTTILPPPPTTTTPATTTAFPTTTPPPSS